MDHTKELIDMVQHGDRKARDRIVEENMGLVYSSARKYLGRGYELEDLVQIGVIGLLKGIDRFDLSQEVQFSTYAVIMIIGEIKRFLRDDGMIKVSRSIKENGMHIRRAKEALVAELSREPTIEEIAVRVGISAEDVVMAQEAMQEVDSLHRTIYQSDGSEICLSDRIADGRDEKEELLNHMVVESLLRELPDKERSIIKMRYFDNKTQVEVANTFGISQVQVSRLEKKILLAMRNKVV